MDVRKVNIWLIFDEVINTSKMNDYIYSSKREKEARTSRRWRRNQHRRLLRSDPEVFVSVSSCFNKRKKKVP